MKKHRHILFVFCDQLRYDCIGAFGNPYIQTPAFDSIANEAVCFNRCYTPSPVCVPARLSLLSGQYPARTGNSNNNPKLMYQGEGFYNTLTKAGYKSCCVGKMHHVWDRYGSLGFTERHTQEELSAPEDDYTKYIKEGPYNYVFDYNGQRTEMYYVPQISQLPAEAHPTQWVGDRSVEFLENCDPENENVFLMSSFIHPHPPFCPPAPWNKLYRGFDMIPPYEPEGYNRDDIAPMMAKSFEVNRLGVSKLDALRLRNFYYACVSFVDYQVGRIVETLKKKGMYEDTLIVVSADHGEMLGDYQNFGKRCMLSPAARVPFFIKAPGVAHEERDEVASLIDLAPTLLSLSDIPYDKNEFDGIDLFAKDREERELIYSQYNTGAKGAYMVASKTDKLVWVASVDTYYYYKGIPEQLNEYDENDARCKYLREKLQAYVASDTGVNAPVVGKSVRKTGPKDFPFGVSRLDHVMRHDEEMARIPAPYKIDLDIVHNED